MTDDEVDQWIIDTERHLAEIVAECQSLARQVAELKRLRAVRLLREANVFAFEQGWLEAEGAPN